jgi:succinoglycan biosynthesis transport protein ExoP
MVPLIDNKKFKDDEFLKDAFTDKSFHGFSEAIRTVRTGIVLGSVDRPIKIMAVTSSVPGEGKTTLSTNLALAFGQMERVLLVDADMRRPSVAKVMNLPPKSKGLSDVVGGLITLEEGIVNLNDFGIDVLPAGTIPPNPLELLSTVRFQNLLVELAERYDRVIIDTAPTQAVSDSLVLSRLVETMVYVIRADETNVDVVRGGLKRLEQVEAPLMGVVLNRFDAKSASRYSYRAKGYYDYYGYGYSSDGYSSES